MIFIQKVLLSLIQNKMRSPITLAVFATTKGHFDLKNIYKSTINDLFNQVGRNFFADSVVHIKREAGDDSTFAEMNEFFSSYGFTILVSHGSWKHYDQSHYIEHGKDIVTLMSDQLVQKNQYVFWLEDDFLIRTADNDVLAAFKKALSLLENNKNILNVRFLKNEADTQLLQFYKNETQNIFSHNDVFSFNPSLLRSRDAWLLAKGFKYYYFNNSHIHIERFATEVLKTIPDVKEGIFSSFKLDYAKAVHIGEKWWTPDVQKTIKFE